MEKETLLQLIKEPPHKYSLMPFWFLNDELKEEKIQEYLNDFIKHGVYGLIPHPRMGLPKSIGFMSERWLYFLKIIIEFAHEKDIKIILYDEGMYPSGSCAGKVVESNPRFSARALIRREKGAIPVKDDEELILLTDKYEYVHTRSMGTIRGVHFGTDDGEAGAPPAGDILNPDAVKRFFELVHEKYYAEFKDYFGNTIIGIFTDEPNPLGRKPIKDAIPWTWGMLDFISKSVGYDFKPCIPLLWGGESSEAQKVQKVFNKVVQKRLEYAFYMPYSKWCEEHGVALTGHPKGPMDIYTLKYFHIPGQDIVWRYVEPFQKNSIEGPESTGPKCSASAKLHYNRKRNMNECFGAYGWNFTYNEMEWLTAWLLVRGVDLLIPHAFYYSIEGPRKDERPPDVGPHNVWWDNYKNYADKCRRLCWFIGEGTPVADVAVLSDVEYLPWVACRVLFENQIDFFYLDIETLLNIATVLSDGIKVSAMKYPILIIDDFNCLPIELTHKLEPMIQAERVITYQKSLPGIKYHANNAQGLLDFIRDKIQPDVLLYPATVNIRYHHAVLQGIHGYLFFNEGKEEVQVKVSIREKGDFIWLDPITAEVKPVNPPNNLKLNPGEMTLLFVFPSTNSQTT
ncbi:MAG: hypothetical protein ACP5UA_00405 [Candidatus Hydrogenedens sp.]